MPAARFRLLLAFAAAFCLPAVAAVAGTVTQTNIVASNSSFGAAHVDPSLINPWGLTYLGTNPFWLSDNGTGKAAVYSGAGSNTPLLSVTVPPPKGSTAASTPTGQIANPTSEFKVGGSPADFLFDTEDGTISGWNGGSSGVLAVDNSKKGAVYKGLALAEVNGTPYLLAANFNSGKVEVYNGTFKRVSQYRSPATPAMYSPFNVAVLGSDIFVTYALADAARHDDVPGKGHGYLDQVTISSAGALTFMRRIQSHGPLDSPWGLAIAPSSFGNFAGALLVGNFGNGEINGYNIASATPTLIGTLLATPRKALVIDGLWALLPGNGGSGGSTSEVYFTAGPNGETEGLLGSLSFNATAADFGE